MITRFIPIVAFAGALVIFFLYVEPTYSNTILPERAAIAADNQTLAAAGQYTAKQNELVSAENQIDPAALARLTTFLPDSADDVGLIVDLDTLAAKDGLELTGIDVAGGQPMSASAQSGPPYASLDLSLSATGTYSSFRSFLASIENSTRLLDVHSLSVKGSSTGVYDYSMDIRLYWLQ